MLFETERVIPRPETCDQTGVIRCDLPKALWLLAHGALGVLGVVFFPSLANALAFAGLSAVTILAGHSVGMHRLLIHKSFETPRWLLWLLVWLGTLVGMAGPFGMIRAHDMRDWHQRQPTCPPHPSHGAGFWRDAYWQLCCRFDLARPPRFVIEPALATDPVLRAIERTWMLQQLPVAAVLFAIGGVGMVLWGVCLRVFVSLAGHWAVGHFAHKRGQQGWRVRGLPVQGYNLPGLGLLTFGENWHGNHHAFPHSVRLGVEPGQMDPGYTFVRALARAGLAWNLRLPESEAPRQGLERVEAGAKTRPLDRPARPEPGCQSG